MWKKIRLSDVEVGQLMVIATKARLPRYQNRAQALLELGGGAPGPRVASKYDVCNQTLYNWVTNFRDRNGAVEWLKQKPDIGKGVTWPEQATPVLLRLLDSSPSEHGYETTKWSKRLLKRHLKQEGFTVGHKMVGEAILRLGYHFDQDRATYVPNKPSEQPASAQDVEVAENVRATSTALLAPQPASLPSFCVGVFPTAECPGAMVIDAFQGAAECSFEAEPAAKPEHSPRRRGRPTKQSARTRARKDGNASRRVSEEEVKHLRFLAQYAPVPEYRQRAAMLLAMAPGDLDEIVLRNSH